MKFYNAMLSPFAARCRMLIYAKGLEVEFSEAWGDFSKEQLSLINPMGKVPVLEDGDLVLPESETICEYLEDRFPGTCHAAGKSQKQERECACSAA